MGLHTIEIDDAQVLTLAELAVELVWATDSATGHPLALVQGR